MRGWTAVVVAVALVAAGCGGREGKDGRGAPTTAGPGTTGTTGTAGTVAAPETTVAGPARTAPSSPTTVPVRPALDAVRIRLTRLATLDAPLDLAVRPGDDTLYVAEKGGVIRALREGAVDARPVLDISDEVSAGSEQGLLGLEFSPDGTRLYVNYTDRAGDTHVDEFRFAGGRVVESSRRRLLLVDQPFANHNGGDIDFGPDGHLYIALGDGGSAGDPFDNGQSLDTLLGKLLRISPRPADSSPYTVPPDNPFRNRPGARPEIYVYGLRNPWRFSFDRQTGDLWIGDVGQDRREEVDFLPRGRQAGANLGWNRFEGTLRFAGPPLQHHVLPIFDYALTGGACSVIGGHVYRGDAIPSLQGVYLFGDFCTGRVMGLTHAGGRDVDTADLGVRVEQLSSFGEDAEGELYVLSLAGPVFRIDPA